MIEKIDKEKISSYIVGTPTALENIMNKMNEMIEYLNNKEKTNKKTYMSTKTMSIIDVTNRDKFLKDGVSVEEFVKAIEKEYPYDIEIGFGDIQEFLNAPAQPILTEDERAILRNIKDKQKVIFSDGSNLWTRDVELEDNFFGQFNHLFQFIKEGEEYSIEELLGGDQ